LKDIKQFFDYMNDVDFKYVVLRNWENLPYNVKTGPHSDLDLLLYDLSHWLEIFPEAERVYESPRVQFRVPIGDSYIQVDARYIGDNYYPIQFEENIISSREYNKRGFWTPNPIHHRLGLVYHACHHKGKNTYKKYLGDLNIPEMLDALKKSEIGWVPPDDKSVGRFNSYIKGCTAIVTEHGDTVSKSQYRYKQHNLIDNEEMILKLLDSPRFPKLIEKKDNSIIIEHCGEMLGIRNLPKDWKSQLLDIVHSLSCFSVLHRDVRLDNLMVKDGLIKLVDFGWARLTTEEDGDYPDLLGYPNRCPLGFNDNYSMNRVIKQIEFELEESEVTV